MKKQIQRHWWFCITLLLLMAACKNGDTNTAAKAKGLYLDYRVKAVQDRDNVSCLFQFRENGPNGKPVFLMAPAKVSFDGEQLTADSAGMSGIFYEVLLPLNGFKGNHSIIYTDAAGNEFREEFVFQPVDFGEMPAVLSRQNFSIQLTGLAAEDYLHIVATDTSFYSNDLNRLDTLQDGLLKLAPDQLTELVNGPVTLILYHEQKKSLKSPTKAGGRLWTTYSLQRDFELKN
jgi:hypothetical protein